MLVLATDVDAVYVDWGGADQRAIGATTAAELRAERVRRPARWGRRSRPSAASSRRPASARAIGRLEDIDGLIDGSAGTQVAAG